MGKRKIIYILAGFAFLVYFVFTRPDASADVVTGMVGAVSGVADSTANFVELVINK